MASATKEAESGNVCEKVMQISNTSHANSRARSIYIGSVSSPNSVDANCKEVAKRRIIRTQEGSAAKKRRSFVKKFRKEWMDEPIFRGWLQPIPNLSEKCWCSVCNVVLLCGHSELEKHASGKKHSDLILLHQLKGDLMDSNPPAAVLDVSNLEECKKDENSMDSTDLTVVPALELSGDGSVDSHLVFHVAQDGTLVEMKMENYDKIANAHEVENSVSKKVTPIPKGTVINVGSTTITKNNAPTVTKTMPAILRQTSKQPQHVIKMTNQMTNQAPKTEDEKRTGMLLAQYATDTEDDDYDDDDDLSDSQQMIKEMKAEAAYQEKKLMDFKRQESELGKAELNSLNSKMKDTDDIFRHIAERELEVRLHHLQEKRRQRFNIYKLKLQEMDARVRAAELELSRGEELHKLRVKHLQLQIMQQEQYGQQESLH
ncbi:UNVERIFIED_CONTAM: hypothetical protein PYX00_002402 [Menopon gallinae]|uniref:Uncharacterized protein n=1 Tax=Menopon gallinae TaxID=328185 RepID=A0AAW2IGP3_9NEOP